MIVRAEMLVAAAVDKGQKSGELAVAGDNQVPRTAGDRPITLTDIGIPSQRLAEGGRTARADPAITRPRAPATPGCARVPW